MRPTVELLHQGLGLSSSTGASQNYVSIADFAVLTVYIIKNGVRVGIHVLMLSKEHHNIVDLIFK